jgi:hypothetical protein
VFDDMIVAFEHIDKVFRHIETVHERIDGKNIRITVLTDGEELKPKKEQTSAEPGCGEVPPNVTGKPTSANQRENIYREAYCALVKLIGGHLETIQEALRKKNLAEALGETEYALDMLKDLAEGTSVNGNV